MAKLDLGQLCSTYCMYSVSTTLVSVRTVGGKNNTETSRSESSRKKIKGFVREESLPGDARGLINYHVVEK